MILTHLGALGVSAVDPRINDDRVLEGYRSVIRKSKRLATCAEVARFLNMKAPTVRATCLRLIIDGRMLTTPQSSGKVFYVPRAA